MLKSSRLRPAGLVEVFGTRKTPGPRRLQPGSPRKRSMLSGRLGCSTQARSRPVLPPPLAPFYPPSLESLLRRGSPGVAGLQHCLRPRLLGWRHLVGFDILLVFLRQREQGRARLATRLSRAARHRGCGRDPTAAELALRPQLPGCAGPWRPTREAGAAGGRSAEPRCREQRAGRRLFAQFK